MIRFLIPVNFAPYTINAIEYGITLAEHVGGEITLLYCYTDFLSEGVESEAAILTQADALKELDQLKYKTLQKIQNPHHVQIKLKVLEGYPEDTIHEFSKEYQPELIVMGTKSKGETIKELLGSVTLDVIKGGVFPVMVVPNNYSFNPKHLTNILFITDFAKCQYASLHKLVQLVASFKTQIHNVQYCSAGKEKAAIEQLNEYAEYCKTTYRNQEMICDYICGQDMLAASQEYIQNHHIDLMAITRSKRNFITKIMHPSETKKILFNTEIPTLFFQP